jgi:hypothetical protein
MMMLRPTASLIPTLFAILAGSAGPAMAQEAATPPSAESRYESLLARVKAGDRDVDFDSLRYAYPQSPRYMPYANELARLRGPAQAALRAGDPQEALRIADAILDSAYVEPFGHVLALAACNALGDSARSAHHSFMLTGLLDSIQRSGSGESPDDPMVVVMVAEEYFYLYSNRLRRSSQSYMSCGAVGCDRLGVRPADSDSTFYLYFDVSRLREAVNRDRPPEPERK